MARPLPHRPPPRRAWRGSRRLDAPHGIAPARPAVQTGADDREDAHRPCRSHDHRLHHARPSGHTDAEPPPPLPHPCPRGQHQNPRGPGGKASAAFPGTGAVRPHRAAGRADGTGAFPRPAIAGPAIHAGRDVAARGNPHRPRPRPRRHHGIPARDAAHAKADDRHRTDDRHRAADRRRNVGREVACFRRDVHPRGGVHPRAMHQDDVGLIATGAFPAGGWSLGSPGAD